VCGIAGRVNFSTLRPVDPALVAGMCDLLAHRGPDGAGVDVEGFVGLGHRRLAIIDLSSAGRQPMASADGRYRITFNGEIYNFRELRAELAAQGHAFRTRTDTEVILAAYERHGVDCLARLRGMFAFAIWDARDRRLFVARDRLGKKPLFYRVDRDGIEFASEPKAFLADPAFVAEADPAAISQYLTLQYVPSPLSAFKGVHKLPPAHYLLVEDGRVRLERYWRLRYQPKFAGTEAEAVEGLRHELQEAVRLRLISDVPLGAFLSGGIDSGTVVALMAAASSGPVKTFSIGFEEKAYNELPEARLVAERYGTEHHEFVVRPDAIGIVPRLVWHYNEPYADSSAIPTFYLAEVTRRHVTVALNGDAGDENLAGYDRYLANVLASRFDPLMPAPLRGALAAAGRGLRRGALSKQFRSRAGRFLEGLSHDPARRYARWLTHFNPSMKQALVTPEFQAAAGPADGLEPIDRSFRESDGLGLVDRTLAVDVENYLPDDLLVKVDIASMAHGLESRSPFVDHRVMEFCASLPAKLKLNGTTKKYLLKRLAAPLLPARILNRPKMGFGVPLDRWFRGELEGMAHDLLLGPRFASRGMFRPAAVRRLLDEHASGSYTWHYQIWNLVMLESWFRMFIDERPSAAPAATPPAVSTVARPSTADATGARRALGV
jgi:asparagine synthase (glutamine-hydrolysing)